VKLSGKRSLDIQEKGKTLPFCLCTWKCGRSRAYRNRVSPRSCCVVSIGFPFVWIGQSPYFKTLTSKTTTDKGPNNFYSSFRKLLRTFLLKSMQKRGIEWNITVQINIFVFTSKIPINKLSIFHWLERGSVLARIWSKRNSTAMDGPPKIPWKHAQKSGEREPTFNFHEKFWWHQENGGQWRKWHGFKFTYQKRISPNASSSCGGRPSILQRYDSEIACLHNLCNNPKNIVELLFSQFALH
jgi:hypothetical protein